MSALSDQGRMSEGCLRLARLAMVPFMTDGLFSTHKTGENRIAASMLAIPNSLALPRAAAIALLEQSEFQLIHSRINPQLVAMAHLILG
jgi:hypothetical protein